MDRRGVAGVLGPGPEERVSRAGQDGAPDGFAATAGSLGDPGWGSLSLALGFWTPGRSRGAREERGSPLPVTSGAPPTPTGARGGETWGPRHVGAGVDTAWPFFFGRGRRERPWRKGRLAYVVLYCHQAEVIVDPVRIAVTFLSGWLNCWRIFWLFQLRLELGAVCYRQFP